MLSTLRIPAGTRRGWPGLLCALLLLLGSPATAQSLSGNPILANYQADPEMDYFNGKYYIYPTTDSHSSGGSSTPGLRAT